MTEGSKKVLVAKRWQKRFSFSILVGAPKGNSTYRRNSINPGVIYNCSFESGGKCQEHDINRLKLSGKLLKMEIFKKNYIFLFSMRSEHCAQFTSIAYSELNELFIIQLISFSDATWWQ